MSANAVRLGRLNAGAPMLNTHAKWDLESVIGSVFYVMAMVDGRILWDGRLPDADPAERRAIYEAEIDTLAALHRLDPRAIGLADYGRAGNYFERQLARWTKQYLQSDGPRHPAMDPRAGQRAGEVVGGGAGPRITPWSTTRLP